MDKDWGPILYEVALIFDRYYHNKKKNVITGKISQNTVQSRFSDILFSDKSRFSDNFAEDHFFSTLESGINVALRLLIF